MGANNVDTSAGGVYEIKYTAEDDTGLKTEIVRSVTVLIKDKAISTSDFSATSIKSNNEILFRDMDKFLLPSAPPDFRYRAASFAKKSANDEGYGKWVPDPNFWGTNEDFYNPAFSDPYYGHFGLYDNQINYDFSGVGYSSWFYEKANSFDDNHIHESEKYLRTISGINHWNLENFYAQKLSVPSSSKKATNYINGTFSPNYGKKYAPFVMVSERCCLFLGLLDSSTQTHACFSFR